MAVVEAWFRETWIPACAGMTEGKVDCDPVFVFSLSL